MRVIWNWTELCGPNDFVPLIRPNYVMSVCAEMSVVRLPVLLLFMLASTYYCGRLSDWIIRTRRETNVIRCRIVVASLMTILPAAQLIWEVYYYTESSVYPIENLVLVIQCFTWFIHTLYIVCIRHHLGTSLRGPKIVIVAWIFCLLNSTLTLRNTFLVFIQSVQNIPILEVRLWFSIVNWMLQLFYLITLSFKEDVIRIRHVDRLRFLAQQSVERRSLMTASYSRFNDEFDPHYLGMACDNEHYSFVSWLTFGWVDRLITKGDKKKLHCTNDLFDLPEWLTPVYVSSKIEEVFRHQPSVRATSPIHLPTDQYRVPKKSLLQALHKCFGKQFYGIGLLKMAADIFAFTAPIFLDKLITFVSHHEEPMSHGYIYMGGLVLMLLISTIFGAHYDYQIHMIGIKIRGALITMIYKKTLELNTVMLNNNFSIGEVVNFMNNDTNNLVQACNSFHSLWSVPFQLIIVLYLLYQQLGIAFLSGVLVSILLIPVNKIITSNIGRLTEKLMNEKDKRVRVMSEIIRGIRVIKYHVWEKYFIDKVNSFRKPEVINLKKRKYLDALCVYFWATTPVTISILTFSTYIFLGGQLTAAKVFTSMALLHMLVTPLNAFPWILNGVAEAWVSVKRIQRLIEVDNLQTQSYYSLMPIQFGRTFDNAVSLSQCSFNWGSRSFQLKNINFSVAKGSFVGITGQVGSGKSTLLAGILAEINKDEGMIASSNMRDGFAFVAQTPWIQKGTIKDNILFGQTYSLEKYKAVIKCCALVKDLQEFPRGDLTLIGDAGITLSGGQKVRLALARAVYQNKGIYLLDDIFAAVDVNVARHLYTHCINGLLKDKTRIICTHNSQFLLSADLVVIMSNGTIINQGRPFEVLSDYDVKTVDVKFHETNSNTYSTMEEWTPTNESEFENNLNDKETQEEGIVALLVYKLYWKSIGSFVGWMLLISMVIMQSSRNVSDLWLSHWVNKITKIQEENMSNNLVDENNVYLYTYTLIGMVNSVATFFRAFIFAYGGIKACQKIHNNLLTCVINAKTSFFDNNSLGRILNRFSSDTNTIDDSLPFILNILLAQLFLVIGTLGSIIYGVPWAIIITIILTPVYYKLQRRYRNSSRELRRISTVALSPLFNHINESLQGLATIRAFRVVSRFERENEDKLENYLKAEFSAQLASLWFNFRLRIIGLTVLFFISLISVIIHQWNLTNPGFLGLSLTYALTLTNMLGGLVSAIAATECDMISLERVLDYVINTESETDNEDSMSSPPFAWPINGIVQFSDVFLKYRQDGPMSLNGVSFETLSSEKIGVIGRTGAGKSSLLAALYKMCDISSGDILIDAVNLSRISSQQIRNRLCVIPQDPFLFEGTIRENIDPFNEYMDSNIWSGLQRCHLVATVKRLGGLGCHLGDSNSLSVGEKQLLCLVRAILKNAKVICVDEATANVDEMTDRKIQETIRTAFKQSTVITIAHKIRTVMDCDRILVMDSGQIIEYESPNVLLQDKNSYFYKLVQQEFK